MPHSDIRSVLGGGIVLVLDARSALASAEKLLSSASKPVVQQAALVPGTHIAACWRAPLAVPFSDIGANGVVFVTVTFNGVSACRIDSRKAMPPAHVQ